jgi:hypothetical protein
MCFSPILQEVDALLRGAFNGTTAQLSEIDNDPCLDQEKAAASENRCAAASKRELFRFTKRS